MGTRTRSCRLSCAARPRSRASPWSLSLCARCSGRAWLPRPRGRRRRAGSVGRRAVRRRLEIDESAEWREEVFVLRKDMAAWANATGTRAGDKPISARNARDSWRGTVSCAGQLRRGRGQTDARRQWRMSLSCSSAHLSKFFAYHSAGGLVGPYRKALRARENRESSEPLGARAGRPAFSAHVGPRKNVSFVISLVVALMASNAPSKSLPATRTEPTPTS